MSHESSLPPFSRRSFLNLSAAATAALACHILTEPMLAQVAIERAEYPNSLWRKQPILSGSSGMFGFVVLLRVLRVTLHFGFCRTHSAPTGA